MAKHKNQKRIRSCTNLVSLILTDLTKEECRFIVKKYLSQALRLHYLNHRKSFLFMVIVELYQASDPHLIKDEMKNLKFVLINDKECEVDSSGAKPEKYHNGILWILNGKFHRVDGPAIIKNNGTKYWYQNNQLHNIKGPAIIDSNGDQAWYIKDEFIGSSDEGFTQEKFEEYLNGKF